MRSETHMCTFDDLIAKSDDEVRAIAIALRALVDEIDPEAVEVPRPGDRAATYGIGPKKMSEAYAYIMPQNGPG